MLAKIFRVILIIFGLLVLLLILFAYGCNTNLGPKREYWQNEINENAPTGTSLSEVEEWAQNHNLKFEPFLLPKNEFVILLEQVPAREWHCNAWNIRAHIYTSDERMVENTELKIVGHECL